MKVYNLFQWTQYSNCLHSTRRQQFYTVSEKKCQYIYSSNFAKYWPLFKILSTTNLAVNL